MENEGKIANDLAAMTAIQVLIRRGYTVEEVAAAFTKELAYREEQARQRREDFGPNGDSTTPGFFLLRLGGIQAPGR